VTEVFATLIQTIEGVVVTENGTNALLKLGTVDQELVLAIPADLLMSLMASLSQACGQAARIQNKDQAIKHVFPCDWWEFGFSPDAQSLLLSFRLPGGMEMSFQVHRDRLPQMRETLSAMEGQAPTPPPGTIRQ
jgi:hypothetical protein